MISLTLLLTVFFGCDRAPADKPAKAEPAHVDHHVDEHDLNTITLTEKAQSRLGIVLAEAKLMPVLRKRTIGGEVQLPPGKTVLVSAPMAGTLIASDKSARATAGQRIAKGDVVFEFKPLLSAEREVLTPSERITIAQTKATIASAQIDAARQVESAKISKDVAQLALDRAEKLLENKAGSQRTVDEAKANLELANETLRSANSRNDFLESIRLDGEKPGEIALRTIASPVAGVLQSLDSSPGETVATGKLLFSVITTADVWIRVPVYAGQWREIDTSQPAMVSEFGESPQTKPREATFVSAPPSANAIATTVDIYYALDNRDGRLHPGQKLSVALPLKSRRESLVVPFKSVLYDIHGGAWVYEQQDQHVYARRRVSVEYVDGEDAILAAGPEPGRKVVTDGAAELFGTEFGVGH